MAMQVTFKHGFKWTLTDVNESSSIKIMRNRPEYNSVYGRFKRSQYAGISRRSSVSVSSGCDEHISREMQMHNNVVGVKTAFATIGAFIQDIMQTHVWITLQVELYCIMRLIYMFQIFLSVDKLNAWPVMLKMILKPWAYIQQVDFLHICNEVRIRGCCWW